MSFSLGGWLSGGSGLLQSQYSTLAQIKWAQINDKPTEVRFLRNGTYQDPQIVRIEFENTIVNADSDLGTATMRRGTIHGVRGHPEVDDLDVDEWDTFVLDENEFTITFVNKNLIGEIQAEFEAV